MSMRIKAAMVIVLVVFVITAAIFASSLFFTGKIVVLGVGIIAAFIVSSLVVRPYNKIEKQNRNLEKLNEIVKAQARQIQIEHSYAKVLLDATPLACILWSRDHKIIECNEETFKLYELKDREEVADHLSDTFPEFQPDGRKSLDILFEMLETGFTEGSCSFEWGQRLPDGTPLPVENTFVRVKYGDEYVIAAYTRDLRQQKQMMSGITRRDDLLNTVNKTAELLLAMEGDDGFLEALFSSMELIGEGIDLDRVQIWQNETIDGELHFVLNYQWLSDYGCQIGDVPIGLKFTYNSKPGWEEMFLRGEYINSPFSELADRDRGFLAPYEIKSLVIIPLFLQDQFWGFFSADDCRNERYLSAEEIDILRSASLMLASAVNRYMQAASIRAANEQLLLALDAAREANNAKSNFLARMSHEIRTPLNVVIGLSELTLESGGLSFEAHDNLEKIYNSGAMLLSIVNDILDISKIEAGKLELVPVEYDIPSLINDTVTQSIMRLDEKPIEFVLSIDENLPTMLHGDDLRIKQIINNLLSNAFKYTKQGMVEFGMSCEREGNTDTAWLTVFVRDTGIGISPEDMEKRLFREYAKMDTMANRAVEGTGLGLSIAKTLVNMMDGTITAESEYGKGSTFTARFKQKRVNDDVIGVELAKNLKELRYSVSKRARNSQLVRIRLPYARVLVVDDNVTNLDVARGMLYAYGMRIDCVTDGQQAIDAVRSEMVRYNAIFMDHMMPGIDGIETTRIIREEIGTEYAKTVPIIALTANAIVGNKEMFLSKGFQAFIAKPIEMAHLDLVVRQWVRDKNMEEEFVTEGRDMDDKRASGSQALLGMDNIAGFNMNKGMERFDWNEKLYQRVLRSYVTNTRLVLEAIREVKEDNLEDYIFAVHGIKASSRGIGAGSVGDMAESLEKMSSAGDLEFVRANHPAFIMAVDELIIAIENVLSKMAVDTPKKDKPDAEILSRIRAACENYDIDRLDAAMAELEIFEYDSDDGLAAWLRENVDRMNYEEIADKLSSLPDERSSD